MALSLFRIALIVTGISGAMLASEAIDTPAIAAEPSPASPAQTPDFATQVQALLAQYPDGGDALAAALTSLAQSQADPAMAAAIMMAALGSRPSSGSVTAIGNVVSGLSGFTSAELTDAINSIVSGAVNPVDTARAILSVVPLLGTEAQQAIGHGLGNAALTLQNQGQTAIASVIVAEVSTSNITALQQTFSETAGTLILPSDNNTQNGNTGGDTTTGTNSGDVPEQPPSAS